MPHKIALDRPTLLLAGLTLPMSPAVEAFACSSAGDARSVLLQLRAARTDLLLLGTTIGETPFDTLMRRVKAAHPRQRWALVAPEIEPAREIDARALGALAIFDGPPSGSQLRELLEKLRPRGQPPPAAAVRIALPRPPGRQREPSAPQG